MKAHITACEHEILAITNDNREPGLTPGEADLLQYLNLDRPGFCERGYGRIKLSQYCGLVNLGSRVLEVIPKVGETPDIPGSRTVLLRLLRESGTYAAFRSIPSGQHLYRTTLLEIFIALFMDEVTSLLRGGLLRQYREEEDDLRFVRGRIVSHRQFSVLFNRPDVIATRFDEHTADNVWNRAIKAGLRAVRSSIVSGDLQRQWVEIMAALDEVADVPMRSEAIERLSYNRQAVRYRTAMQWVEWILALLSPSLRAGTRNAPAFLFDMNVIFENAVANQLRRGFAQSAPEFTVAQQVQGHYLGRLHDTGSRAFALKPDIALRGKGGNVILIADSKWKLVDSSASGHLKPARSDMYQMHAYASAFGVDRLVLIYPQPSEISGARPTSYQLPPAGGRRPIVSVACVDVQQDGLPFTIGAEALAF